MANKPGAKSNKSRNIVLSIVGGILLLLGSAFINFFIYPFTTTHPNYSDVEALYDSVDLPGTWELVELKENEGISGRKCSSGDITGTSYCYQKQGTYLVPQVMTDEGFNSVFSKLRCENKRFYVDTYPRFRCTSGTIVILATYKNIDSKNTVIISSHIVLE